MDIVHNQNLFRGRALAVDAINRPGRVSHNDFVFASGMAGLALRSRLIFGATRVPSNAFHGRATIAARIRAADASMMMVGESLPLIAVTRICWRQKFRLALNSR